MCHCTSLLPRRAAHSQVLGMWTSLGPSLSLYRDQFPILAHECHLSPFTHWSDPFPFPHQVSLCPGRLSASRASCPALREAPQPSGQVPSLLQSACMSSPVCVSGSQCHGAAVWVQQDSGLPVLARKFHLKEEAGLTPELGECPAVQWTIRAGSGWD